MLSVFYAGKQQFPIFSENKLYMSSYESTVVVSVPLVSSYSACFFFSFAGLTVGKTSLFWDRERVKAEADSTANNQGNQEDKTAT